MYGRRPRRVARRQGSKKQERSEQQAGVFSHDAPQEHSFG
jgi:hypothetical protein